MVDADERSAFPGRIKASAGFLGGIGGEGLVIRPLYPQEVGVSLKMGPLYAGDQGQSRYLGQGVF